MINFETIKEDIEKEEIHAFQKIDDDFCPNCWGRQEYGGAFYNAVKAEGINTKNINQKKGWIQAYVEKHLTGIKLKVVDAQLACNSCSVRYELINN